MKNSEIKAKFRTTKTWKVFRQRIFDRQDGKDFITGKKLYKGWQCHHGDMSAENYDILVEGNFFALNKAMHDTVHTLFRYYKTDKSILQKLEQVLEKMDELNK